MHACMHACLHAYVFACAYVYTRPGGPAVSQYLFCTHTHLHHNPLPPPNRQVRAWPSCPTVPGEG